jgi:putative PIN family toxin of toxin-antitoxin system
MGLDGSLDIVVSQSIIDETLRVMKEKFRAKPMELERALAIMTTSARMVQPVVQVTAVRVDPNDDHVVSCAVAASAECIITGDKDLLRMKEYEGVKMLKLGEFLRSGQSKG